jgi:hypothetical protein
LNDGQIIIFETLGQGWRVDDRVFDKISRHNLKETLLSEASWGELIKTTGNTNGN